MLFILPSVFYSQTVETLKIKKEDYSIYFFQKGIKSDTISKTSGNLFVLKIGISRRCDALIEIDNGRLVPTKNDSIYQLVYMPNINYRHRFRDSAIVTEPPKNKLSPAKKSTVSPCSVFKTEVNGSGNSVITKQISIRIKNNANDSLYLSNKYYYR